MPVCLLQGVLFLWFARRLPKVVVVADSRRLSGADVSRPKVFGVERRQGEVGVAREAAVRAVVVLVHQPRDKVGRETNDESL